MKNLLKQVGLETVEELIVSLDDTLAIETMKTLKKAEIEGLQGLEGLSPIKIESIETILNNKNYRPCNLNDKLESKIYLQVVKKLEGQEVEQTVKILEARAREIEKEKKQVEKYKLNPKDFEAGDRLQVWADGIDSPVEELTILFNDLGSKTIVAGLPGYVSDTLTSLRYHQITGHTLVRMINNYEYRFYNKVK